MKRFIFSLFLILGLSLQAQIYSLSSGNTLFFSSTILEDIKANSEELEGLMDLESKEFYFEVRIKSFNFEKALMQEHFNENYMESDKYPTGNYTGKFIGDLDFSKDGVYRSKLTGILNIHGVKLDRELDLLVEVKEGVISLQSDFRIVLKDHKIKIPKIVFKNIAEVIDVKVNAVMQPYKE